MNNKLIEGIDYIMENGKFVLTAKFLLERGFCCENGCRNCPYKQSIENITED